MSESISYFFNHEGSLAEVTSIVNTQLGCSLSPYEGDETDMFAWFLAVELSLCADHGLENDREMNFENYRYQLRIRTALPNALARPIQFPTMVAIIYALYLRLRITGMLVDNVDRVLARYEERSTNIFDRNSPEDLELFAIGDMSRWIYNSESGEPFVNFSRQLSLIEGRVEHCL